MRIWQISLIVVLLGVSQVYVCSFFCENTVLIMTIDLEAAKLTIKTGNFSNYCLFSHAHYAFLFQV